VSSLSFRIWAQTARSPAKFVSLLVGRLVSAEADYYENEQNVSSYIQFTPAHDGAELVDALRAELPEQSSVLELGMGPGKDFKLLSEYFCVTGSDRSNVFLNRFRELDPDADLAHLDARTIETDRRFDAIFSNKALIHMSSAELAQSFARQHTVLNPGGVLLHSFWYGEGQSEFNELTLVYHNETDLAAMLEPDFDVIGLQRHAKMADGDSIYVLARKR
jgi:SAM-dependent methyltransferase